MESKAVIQLIRRRQAKFRERCKARSGVGVTDETRVNIRIAEEYDSLLAEIEVLDSAVTKSDQDVNDVAESQILGDQGQSGG
jgi:hypothetical protein